MAMYGVSSKKNRTFVVIKMRNRHTMDYVKELEKYAPAHTDEQVAKEVAKIKMAANRNGNVEVYKF